MFNAIKNNFIWRAFSLVFRNPFYITLSLSLSFGLFAIYYFLFSKVTTLEVFLSSNTALYNWLSITTAILISVLFGAAVSFALWQWKSKKEKNLGHSGNTLIASFLGAVATGCPVCGAFLASVLGISGSLFAFPFQGLEIKFISLGLLSFAIVSSAKSITSNICQKISLKPIFIGISLLILVISLPNLADKFNFNISFQPDNLPQHQLAGLASNNLDDSESLLSQINPPDGYIINAVYGDIGPQLLESGAIDFEKIKSLYEKVGNPLTEEQIKILTKGSNEKIKITPKNSHFLLNFLWALGIANKNPILDEGPMIKYGQDQIGRFASTGGWTLGAKDSVELYSKYQIITLNEEQQKILEDFAYNSYRPCCSNPTAFPDCNHGAAALALGEIMASRGASAEKIFEAFKYFNAFWFPQTYFDVAKYFQVKEGKNWNQVDGRIAAGRDYSTPQGWQRVRQWLSDNNLIEKMPSGGGGCGI